MRIVYSKVISQPSTEPVTLNEAKLHLRVDHSDEDALINILIQAARELAEQHTNRSFITQTRRVKLDHFPGYAGCNSFLPLPNGAVISLTGEDVDENDLGIQYYDESEVLQTLSSSDYWVDTDSNIARVIVKNSWPATFDMPNAVIVTYTAGYGSTSSVPRPIKQAILLILGHLYEHRESVSSTEMYELPMGAQTLLSTYVLEQSVVYDRQTGSKNNYYSGHY